MKLLMTGLGKLIILSLKVFRRKGTALPGLVIEKLYPNYLNVMLDQLPRGVIIITGTNGKTTTTKIATELLRASGLRVLTNPTGTNFVRGIIAACAAKATFTGKLPYDIAVFEQDEAHAVLFAKRYKPTGVVALNVMRDQMDRFGEIDTTAKLIGKLVASAKDWVILNANDKRIAALATERTCRGLMWFGHSRELKKMFVDDDQLYSKHPTFFEAAKPDVQLETVEPGVIELSLRLGNRHFRVETGLEGTHNAINMVAALMIVLRVVPEHDFDADHAVSLLSGVQPAFGRGERVFLPVGRELQIQLVKNPAGFRHALRTLERTHYPSVGIMINDDYADGRDVSWLWDVDFGSLKPSESAIITGGTRAADMALRLKYEEIETIAVEPEIKKFIDELLEHTYSTVIVFCTYTAMLQLRQYMKRYDKRLKREGI